METLSTNYKHKALITFTYQVGVVIVYVLLSQLTHAFFSANGFATIFWPASGVALTAILLGGNRFCIAVFAGAMITELWIADHSLAASFFIALGDTFEPLLAAWLLSRAKSFNPDITRLSDFFRLVAVGFLTPSISAVIGSASLLLSTNISRPAYFTTLIQWWMGHTLGMMLVASLILVWRTPPADWQHRALKIALQLVASFLVGQIIFLDWFHEFFGSIHLGYWMYLIITFGAVRLGKHGVLVILCITVIQALAGAAMARGFFEHDMQQSGLTNLWCYIVVLYGVGMSLAAVLWERSTVINKFRDNTARLEEGQRLAKFGNWEWDTKTGTHTWSKEIFRIYGRDLALHPAAYPEVQQYFTPESWKKFAAEIEKVLAKGGAYECDAEVVRPDGSHRWITVRGEATCDASGKVVNLHSTVQDVTERKQADETIRKSRNQLRAFVQNAPVSIAMFDRKMNYLATSGRWIEEFGRGYADLTGRNDYKVNPDLPAEWKMSHQQALAGATLANSEDMWVQADGSIHWLRWAVLPWIDENGSIGGIIISAEDITAQKKMEMELWRQRNEMAELHKLQIASQTAAAIAHELNQPLLAISSYNEAALMLMDSGKADFDRIRTAIEKSKQQSLRAGQSIREMLNYLSLRDFKSDEFDLNMEIRDLVRDIRKEHDVKFNAVFQLEEGLPLIRANLGHMKKAISNLLINSLEAMQEAGVPQPSVTVTVCTKKDANLAQMTILDNGPGIKEAIHQNLFKPFNTSKTKGIGMGLAISRSLIEMNGGQLWFEQQEGTGATFHLTLPFAT